MKCNDALNLLSAYIDDMLETESAVEVSAHLNDCGACRREFARLADLRKELASLKDVDVPPYMAHLFQLRLAGARNSTWDARLRSALEYRWSRIRTTEGIWFYARILGSAMTVLLFFTLSSTMNPIFLPPPATQKVGPSQELMLRLSFNVLKNLGMIPMEAQKKPVSPTDPMINDLWLLYFGQSTVRSGNDYTFSVVTMIDRSGTAKIQDVLEYPQDSSLLSDINSILTAARCRPALQNGRAVDSHLMLTFSKISVYD